MKYTLKEWLAELEKRYGKDSKKWAFKCPACGKISTVQEFLDVGAERNVAYVECIGRHTGKGEPKKDSKDGCNWAAYGLFGTLGQGDIVVTEDGKETEIFSIA